MKNLEDYSMKNLEEFQIEPEAVSYIDEGVFGEIYRLTSQHVGKFLFSKWNEIKQLQKERKIAEIAYEEEIPVPKPEGVFRVKYPFNGKTRPAFIMEYIEGPTLLNIYEKEKDSMLYYKVLKLAEEGIEKANKTILIPAMDVNNSENIIWCPKREKVYLTDFGLWGIKK